MEMQGDSEEVQISKEAIAAATAELIKVSKSHRSRKKRVQFVADVVTYLSQIVTTAAERENYMNLLIERANDIGDLVHEVLKSLVALEGPSGKLDDLLDIGSILGVTLELMAKHLHTRALESPGVPRFFDLTNNLLTQILSLLAENTDSWFHADIVSDTITYLLYVWINDPSYEELYQKWSKGVVKLMQSLGSGVLASGDFAIQYSLLIVIQQWLAWMDIQHRLPYLSKTFASLEESARNSLLIKTDVSMDDTYDNQARSFLNKINLTLNKSKRIASVRCLHFFAENKEIQRPENNQEEFWIDFSFKTKRIHCFIAVKKNNWINLNIRADHIDSICVSWIRKKGGMNETQGTETQMSRMTTLTHDSLLFLHILLKEDFHMISKDLGSLSKFKARNLFIVFEDIQLLEQTIEAMGFPVHRCDDTNCAKPTRLCSKIQGLVESPLGSVSSQSYSPGQTDPMDLLDAMRELTGTGGIRYHNQNQTPFSQSARARHHHQYQYCHSHVPVMETSTSFCFPDSQAPSSPSDSDADCPDHSQELTSEKHREMKPNLDALRMRANLNDSIYEDPIPRELRSSTAPKPPRTPFRSTNTNQNPDVDFSQTRSQIFHAQPQTPGPLPLRRPSFHTSTPAPGKCSFVYEYEQSSQQSQSQFQSVEVGRDRCKDSFRPPLTPFALARNLSPCVSEILPLSRESSVSVTPPTSTSPVKATSPSMLVLEQAEDDEDIDPDIMEMLFGEDNSDDDHDDNHPEAEPAPITPVKAQREAEPQVSPSPPPHVSDKIQTSPGSGLAISPVPGPSVSVSAPVAKSITPKKTVFKRLMSIDVDSEIALFSSDDDEDLNENDNEVGVESLPSPSVPRPAATTSKAKVQTKERRGKGYDGGRPKKIPTKRVRAPKTKTVEVETKPKTKKKVVMEQTRLNVTVTPRIPMVVVPKSLGRVPCYQQSFSEVEFEKEEEQIQESTQFVDPYEIRPIDFLNDTLKTYGRKRKRRVNPSPRPRPKGDLDEPSDDDSIDILLEEVNKASTSRLSTVANGKKKNQNPKSRAKKPIKVAKTKKTPAPRRKSQAAKTKETPAPRRKRQLAKPKSKKQPVAVETASPIIDSDSDSDSSDAPRAKKQATRTKRNTRQAQPVKAKGKPLTLTLELSSSEVEGSEPEWKRDSGSDSDSYSSGAPRAKKQATKKNKVSRQATPHRIKSASPSVPESDEDSEPEPKGASFNCNMSMFNETVDWDAFDPEMGLENIPKRLRTPKRKVDILSPVPAQATPAPSRRIPVKKQPRSRRTRADTPIPETSSSRNVGKKSKKVGQEKENISIPKTPPEDFENLRELKSDTFNSDTSFDWDNFDPNQGL